MNSGIPEQIKQALVAALEETDSYSMSRFVNVANLKEARLDRILTALAPHFTQQPTKGEERLQKLANLVWETRWAGEQEDYQQMVGIAAEIRSGNFNGIDAARLNTEIKTK